METRSEGHRYTFGQLIKMLYANFMVPVFVSLLFMDELLGSTVVQVTGMSPLAWHVLRLCLVIAAASLRFLLFREELQFQFDQSYYIISRMISNEVEKTEDTFFYVRQRVTQNFYDTWFTIF